MKKNTKLIYSILFFTILVIILYVCRNKVIENYDGVDNPESSSPGDIGAGASTEYGRPYEVVTVSEPKTRERKCPSCENSYADKKDICVLCEGGNKDCRFADITKNVDIDKYVLKSSVPPCPDLTEYAKKNQVPPYPFNKDDWIRKSEIPACPEMPNMDEWIRKSEVPNCANLECPKCPVCPIAPSCPPTKVVEKNIYKNTMMQDERLSRPTMYKGLDIQKKKQNDLEKYESDLGGEYFDV